MLAQAPTLHRAVLECTQSQDSNVSRETQRILKSYLEDRQSVDSVYKAIVNRAISDYNSTAVVSKCINLLKQFLPRHIPSRTVLLHVTNLCRRLQLDQNISFPGEKSGVRYVLLQAQNLLGPPYDFSLKQERADSKALSPVPSSGEDQITTALSDSAADSSPAHPPTSISAALELSSAPCPVQPASLAAALQGYLPGPAVQEPGNMFVLSTTDIISTIVEEDPVLLAAQVQDIVTATMMRHSTTTTAWTSPTGDTLAEASRMYSPPLYMHQDPLLLEDTEVAGVLGIVCGEVVTEGHTSRGPRPRSWRQEESLWQQPPGQQLPPGQQPVGHMCAAILVKLLMDMWIQNPPPASFILASRLLSSTLSNPRPDVRCRAFDLLYNLSLHSALLGTPDSEETAERVAGLEQWLRGLLYFAIGRLLQLEEGCEEVWQSAVAVCLHLLTQSGHLMAGLAEDTPPAVAAALLHHCLQFRWADELYAQLAELAAFVLLGSTSAVPAAQQVPSRTSSDSTASQPRGSSDAGGHPRQQDHYPNQHQQLQQRLEEFGGLTQLLTAFCHCPTHASRQHLLRVLLAAVSPPDLAPEQASSLAALLTSPSCALVLQTTLRLPARGLAVNLHSALMRAVAAPSPGALLSATEGIREDASVATDFDGMALMRVLMALETAAMGVMDIPEAPVMEAALQQLPPGSADPLAAWQLLRRVLPAPLGSPGSIQLVVLHLHRLIDASIAQHQVASLAQLATVGLLPQPPGASVVLQGAAVPQALMTELLSMGPPGVAAVMKLVQRLLAALQHRVMVVARGREAVTARRHLAAAAAATWGTLVQWLRQLPEPVPRHLLCMVGQEVLWLPWVDSTRRGRDLPDQRDLESGNFGRENTLSSGGESRTRPSGGSESRWSSLDGSQQLPLPLLSVTSDLGHSVDGPWASVGGMLAGGGEDQGGGQRNWEEGGAAVQLVRGTGLVAGPALQLLGGLTLVPLIQSMSSVPPSYLEQGRGWHVRLHGPPTGRSVVLWSPWTDDNADMRLALVMLLLVHWQLQPGELAGAAAQQVVRSWLEDGDPRIRYIGGRCLQLQLLATQPEQYWSSLRVLVLQAQRLVQHQLVDNPLLQMSALQEMKLV